MAGLRLKDPSMSILSDLSGKIDRFNKIPAYLNRVVYKQYQARQRKRFVTRNVSEGTEWPELNPKYAAWKKKKYAGAFGGGRKMMIRTGRLFAAVVGDPIAGVAFDHKKPLIKGTKLTVMWSNPYQQYTEDVRPVNEWDEKQDLEMVKDYVRYLMGVKK